MVDTADLKSSDACVVPVRVRPPAPKIVRLLWKLDDFHFLLKLTRVERISVLTGRFPPTLR